MSDIHALSGAYAVDALDDVDRAQFERHLAECAACRAEVASFRETTARLAETEASSPPASLREGVLSGIRQIRPLPPQQPSREEPAGVRRRRLPQILAAAAAVVLLALGAVVWHPWQRDHTTLADRILHARDAVSVTQQLPGGAGEIRLVRSASLGRAVMVGDHVPDPSAGKTYQMWLQQPGQQMVSAGLMPDPDRPTVLSGDAASAKAAAVSIEPAGGSDHPSTQVVAVFSLTSPGGGDGSR
ncbi:MAG TPA: anti-sigma factor [Nocardioides sp.]|uniref:anti-sigma factor n=1 Tax=Nocardioides sp. TaxID=35761 RepID=UPI002F418A26